MKPNLHPREADRLAALSKYKILDSAPETAFDDLTLIASQICDTPIALISLIDDTRQWFKSHLGMRVSETPKEQSFCAFAILENDLFVVEDAALDARFCDSVMVNRDPKIRFYAGAQFLSTEGLPLGTLCVIDRKPRKLSEVQIKALEALSRQVQAQMELRRNLLELKHALAARDEAERIKQLLMQELQKAFDDTKRLSAAIPLSSTCKLSVTIPADIQAIDPVVDSVMELARQMNSAQGREFEIETSIREALANAIIHGCKSDSTKSIQCLVSCDKNGQILVVIRDPGGSLDPDTLPDPTLQSNIHSDHGRGMYLINELMDDVKIVVEKAIMTEVKMNAN